MHGVASSLACVELLMKRLNLTFETIKQLYQLPHARKRLLNTSDLIGDGVHEFIGFRLLFVAQ